MKKNDNTFLYWFLFILFVLMMTSCDTPQQDWEVDKSTPQTSVSIDEDDDSLLDDKGKGTIVVFRDYSFGFPLATRKDKTQYQFEFGNPQETKYKVRVPAGKYTIQIVTANREIYQIPIIVRSGSRTLLGWNEF